MIEMTTVAVLLARGCRASSAQSNLTSVTSEDDGDELLANMNFTVFKERFRRLIPYMTFYVANNYVQAQALAQNYAKELISNALLRKPPLLLQQQQQQQQHQHSLTRLTVIPSRGGNKYRVDSATGEDKKFIPSVQFDPRNIGGDNDYFAPVKYNAKIDYTDYSTPSYTLYQVQKIYPEITTPPIQLLRQDNRYLSSPRPLLIRPPTREHSIEKPPLGSPQNNYDRDYAARPNAAANYINKEFESLRYIPAPVLYETTERKPSTISPAYRKPSVSLKSIIESLQLSERLPEVLNKDNIDSSIKTLVEILRILHKSRGEDVPQSREPPPPLLPPLPPIPTRPPVYERYKPKTYSRPKVITETKFQVTPNPLFITDDPERYKPAPSLLANDVQIKTPLSIDYGANHVKDEKIEYYVPHIQDLSDEPKQAFKPSGRPVDKVTLTEHSYEITEDFTDDVLQDERYTLPISTEAPVDQGHASPNEVTLAKPKMPLPALKYGATRGKPHVDYPAYAIIPKTDFSCKEQRYKGFFGDPATRCQVWHYCDLNGGKSSFLCPNGTIFSQIALTCDWWFNVKCETTTQLYVLNERLYKYILPIMPKFPEDFTGPEVDRYLELKFKQMEAKLKEKKLKKQQEEKDKHKGKPQTTSDDN